LALGRREISNRFFNVGRGSALKQEIALEEGVCHIPEAGRQARRLSNRSSGGVSMRRVENRYSLMNRPYEGQNGSPRSQMVGMCMCFSQAQSQQQHGIGESSLQDLMCTTMPHPQHPSVHSRSTCTNVISHWFVMSTNPSS
jgi:hypothetical protein